jgi:hypothetical protein
MLGMTQRSKKERILSDAKEARKSRMDSREDISPTSFGDAMHR